jgi:hypothetical protein
MCRFLLLGFVAIGAGAVGFAADVPRTVKPVVVRKAQFDPMFPDGLVHDFGKLPRGVQARHAFRVVNTSGVPLQILSLRQS